ncbi:hypothetical protein BB560_004773 [Smittium megazygosporum]|uniref:DUF1168 domain-containing protein n=1 Tax=Smittium megazygosporum TaxID=133381 RepID=A0A2T9Z8A1_9FUNG|nr:hypothetical protein BB560_004773 [Smittium megazygosporum]
MEKTETSQQNPTDEESQPESIQPKQAKKHFSSSAIATNLQRVRLERLMANPEKPVHIPKTKSPSLKPPPEFVKSYAGSSAGAGSGEFHVYRNLRRKEIARQAIIKSELEKDRKKRELEAKISEKEKLLQMKTEKRRAKRLKRKTAKKDHVSGTEKTTSEPNQMRMRVDPNSIAFNTKDSVQAEDVSDTQPTANLDPVQKTDTSRQPASLSSLPPTEQIESNSQPAQNNFSTKKASFAVVNIIEDPPF